VRSGDARRRAFRWYGPNTPEKAFGYRVIGDGFVIEMGSVDAAAQHLHTIYTTRQRARARRDFEQVPANRLHPQSW
jgi:hypothetical protein